MHLLLTHALNGVLVWPKDMSVYMPVDKCVGYTQFRTRTYSVALERKMQAMFVHVYSLTYASNVNTCMVGAHSTAAIGACVSVRTSACVIKGIVFLFDEGGDRCKEASK